VSLISAHFPWHNLPGALGTQFMLACSNLLYLVKDKWRSLTHYRKLHEQQIDKGVPVAGSAVVDRLQANVFLS